MTDDDHSAFDADLRRRATGRKVTLDAVSEQEKNIQAAFAAALVPATNRASEIARRLFGEPATPDEDAA